MISIILAQGASPNLTSIFIRFVINKQIKNNNRIYEYLGMKAEVGMLQTLRRLGLTENDKVVNRVRFLTNKIASYEFNNTFKYKY